MEEDAGGDEYTFEQLGLPPVERLIQDNTLDEGQSVEEKLIEPDDHWELLNERKDEETGVITKVFDPKAGDGRKVHRTYDKNGNMTRMTIEYPSEGS